MADERTIGQRRIDQIKAKNQADEIDAIKGIPKLLNQVNKRFAEDILGKFIKETKSGNLTLDKAAIEADAAGAGKAIKEYQREGAIKAELEDLSDDVKAGFKKLGEDSKQLQKRDAEGNKKFLQKLFGTPGDRKQAQAEMVELFKSLPGKITNKLGNVLKGAFASIKDGIGTFFDIIKTGLLLIGGIAALEAFAEGWEKATAWMGANAGFGDKLASGFANIVGSFTNMTEAETQELAIKMAGLFESIGNVIKRIITAFTNILGLGVDEDSRTLGDKIKDWSIAIGTSLLLFTNIASTMATKVLVALGSLFKQVVVFLFGIIFGKNSLLRTNAILGGSKMMAALKALRVASLAFLTVTIPAMAATVGGLVMAVGTFLLTNPIGWIILALIAVGTALYVFWDDIKAMFQAVQDAGGIFIYMRLAWAKVTDGFGRFVNGLIDFYNYMVDKVNYVLPGPFELSKISSSKRFTTDNASRIRAEMQANREEAEQTRNLEAATQERQNNVPGAGMEDLSAQMADFEAQMQGFNLENMGAGNMELKMPVINNQSQTTNITQSVLKTRPGYTLDFNGAYSY